MQVDEGLHQVWGLPLQVVQRKDSSGMRELFKLLARDILEEGFTARELFIYGILAPLGLIAACVLAEMICR